MDNLGTKSSPSPVRNSRGSAVLDRPLTGTVRVLAADTLSSSRDVSTGAIREGLGPTDKLLAFSGTLADAITPGSLYQAFSITTPTGVQLWIIDTAPSP